jgi:hypothetical protein
MRIGELGSQLFDLMDICSLQGANSMPGHTLPCFPSTLAGKGMNKGTSKRLGNVEGDTAPPLGL